MTARKGYQVGFGLGTELTEPKPEQARIVADLAVNSLDMVEIPMKTEEEFNFTLPDERRSGRS